MDADYLPEMLMRGGAMGVLLASAVMYAGRTRTVWRYGLGALFFVGTAAYAIVSTPAAGALDPRVFNVLAVIATCNSVFFWWLATALFDDEFEWRWWRWLPLVFMLGLVVLRRLVPDLVAGSFIPVLQQFVVIAMMGHALWLALVHWRGDLIEQRRRFRLFFAGLIAVLGLTIAVVELSIGQTHPPLWLTSLHAGTLLVFAIGFSAFLLRPVSLFAKPEAAAVPTVRQVSGLDQAELKRLLALMDDGVYRDEAMTIRALAERVNIPEHRLRRLINSALGFRNFNAFLNQYRIIDACEILADPEQARRQITQIALDLGYGSVGPFNRAFKTAEGMTPTAYRKLRLEPPD